MTSSKRFAASLALATVLGLFVFKLVVGLVTGSISVLAQMADSFLDILSVGLTFVVVILAIRPPDAEHPFGHGKLESISAIVQSLFIFGAAATIVYTAVQRIIYGAEIEMTQAGMAVMALSVIASVLLSRYLRRVSRETDSPALAAITLNINADIYSAGGVLVGLTVIFISGGRLALVDPILAILVSLIILRSGYEVIKHSFGALIDARLPRDEEERITNLILSHNNQLVGIHDLRSRKSGSERYVDLHLVMPGASSLENTHKVCDHLEEELKGSFSNLNIIIHVEPCNCDCPKCALECSNRSN
jgi:cation diffusion facilitator family transporter